MSSSFWNSNCCPVGVPDKCPSGWVGIFALVHVLPEDPIQEAVYLLSSSAAVNPNSYAINRGGDWVICPPNAGDKASVFGSCGILCWNGSAWVDALDQMPALGMVGTGVDPLAPTSGGTAWLRRIRGSGVASASIDGTGAIVVHVPQPTIPAGGEVNTASNVGPGARFFKQKNLLNFEFRTLVQGDNIQLEESADAVRISAIVPATAAYSGSNLGSGAKVFKTLAGNTFNFRTILLDTEPGSGLSISEDTNEVKFTFAPSTSMLDVFGDTGNLYNTTPDPGNIMFWLDGNGWSNAPMSMANVSGSGYGVFDSRVSPTGFDFLFRRIAAGTGISLSESAGVITAALNLGVTNLGTGAPVLVDVASASVRSRSFKAGPGIDIDTTNPNEIVISGTSGGGSGAGVSGTAFVGEWAMTGSQAVNRWGLSRTYVRYNTNMQTVATISKNVNGDEFTINKAGKYDLDAKVVLNENSGQMNHHIVIEYWNGSTWADINISKSWAYSPAQEFNLVSLSTGTITVSANAGDKFRVGVITSGGNAEPTIRNEGNYFRITEVVGPLWEVVTRALVTGAYALTESDSGKVILLNGGTLNLPNNLPVSFSCRVIQNNGTQITCTALSGATLHNRQSHTKSAGQHAEIRLTVKTNSGGTSATYNLSGDTAA